jgi:lysophospholipase L1-like esterase
VSALLAAIVLMTTAPTDPVYVALGDSTGVGVGAHAGGGYPARLARRAALRGDRAQLSNLCVSGARAADVVAGQLAPAVAARPGVVTLGIGINDVTRGTDLADFRRDYERVAEALAGTGARVVVVNVPDLSRSPLAQGDETRRLVRRRVEAVNEAIAAAARRRGFVLVDLFQATGEELARRADLLSEDRFHPSDAGYERWTELVWPAFEAALRASASPHPATLSSGAALR